MKRLAYLLVLIAVLTASPAAAAPGGRVMVGEDILIAEHEVVEEVVCVGCSVRIDGEVRGDTVVIAGSLEIYGEVDGDAAVIAGGLKSSGTIDGDAVVIAGGAELGGQVAGDVAVIAGGVKLLPGTVVRGDVAAFAGGIEGVEQARIEGEVAVTQGDGELAVSGLLFLALALVLLALIMQPLLTLAAFLVMGERRVQVLADTMRHRPGMSFLVGLVTMFAWFVLSVVSAILAPLGNFPFGLAIFVLLVAGYCGVSFRVGRSLLPASSALAAAVLGAVLVTLLQAVPVLGWAAFLILALLAIGAAVLSGFGSSTEWLIRETEPDILTPYQPTR